VRRLHGLAEFSPLSPASGICPLRDALCSALPMWRGQGWAFRQGTGMMLTDKTATRTGRWARRGLRWPLWCEITLALLLKLALLMALKMAFFSHPLSKQDAAARLGAMIDGGAAASVAAPTNTPHKTEAQ
jgi:hypothetical protein